MEHIRALIKLIDGLSDKSICRLYRLAEYLYLYAEDKDNGKAASGKGAKA